MYKQLDGVAVGSSLGPALANTFVGFHESRLFDNTAKPGVFFRYLDDSFDIFGSELDFDHSQEKLNVLHPALKFSIMICSKTKLGSERDKIEQLLIENGYPEDVLISCINQKLANLTAEKPIGPEKCPVHLKLPWISNVSSKYKDKINETIASCFFLCIPCGVQH